MGLLRDTAREAGELEAAQEGQGVRDVPLQEREELRRRLLVGDDLYRHFCLTPFQYTLNKYLIK